MKLKVERVESGWTVRGPGISATVHGSMKWGPNGNMIGLGAKKHRAAIMDAVREFRDSTVSEDDTREEAAE